MLKSGRRAVFVAVLVAIFGFTLTSYAATPFQSDLRWGMRNSESVKQLQGFLKEQGVFTEEITGNYYGRTYHAVEQFQKKNSIYPASGYFGPLTRAKANSLLSTTTIEGTSTSAAAVPVPRTMSLFERIANDTSLSLQARLSALWEHTRSLQDQIEQYKNARSKPKDKPKPTTPGGGSSGGGTVTPPPITPTIPVPGTTDTIKPSVQFSNALKDSSNGPVTVAVTFSEPVLNFIASDVVVSNGTVKSFTGGGSSYSFSVVPTAEGIVTVALPAGVAADAAGNTNYAAPSVSWKHDTTAPVITGLTNDSTVRRVKTWVWNSESSAMYRFSINTSLNSAPTGEFSSVRTASQTQGTGKYYIHVQAMDTVGNISPTVTVSVELDNTAPVLTEVSRVVTPTTDTTPNYTFHSSERGGILYGGDCSSADVTAVVGNNQLTFKTLAQGTHSNCTIQVRDAAGNQGMLAITPFVITSSSTPPVTPPPQAGEKYINAYTTAYTYWDNTPPGSAAISHPIIHQKAGGTGTFADPITIAVGHTIVGGKQTLDYPAGTKFYIPNVRRYFIVEDSCGDGNTPQNGPCHTGYPSGTTTWVDMWIDGATGTRAASDACAGAVTDENGEVHLIIQNPASDYVVVPGPVFSNGVCTSQFGNTPVKK